MRRGITKFIAITIKKIIRYLRAFLPKKPLMAGIYIKPLELPGDYGYAFLALNS
jgi:hypothetical protein